MRKTSLLLTPSLFFIGMLKRGLNNLCRVDCWCVCHKSGVLSEDKEDAFKTLAKTTPWNKTEYKAPAWIKWLADKVMGLHEEPPPLLQHRLLVEDLLPQNI